ncbi:MAG: Fe-S cluster assembly ATPase SufC [Thermomicrobiales bacterium]
MADVQQNGHNKDANALVIEDLRVSVGDRQIVRGLNLTIRPGEVHAIMGPNGSGKSTLANALMGNPAYTVDGGHAWLKGQDLLELETDERARLGLFLAFQYPTEIPGVRVEDFLRLAYNSTHGTDLTPIEFRMQLWDTLGDLQMDASFAKRYVNEGFSGGEKKRNEIVQMAILQPTIAVLDETDSGLDIDALRIVADGVNKLIEREGDKMGVLVITHYQRLLNYIKPDFVHVLARGRIIKEGGPELALELEEKGYGPMLAELGEELTPEEIAAPTAAV